MWHETFDSGKHEYSFTYIYIVVSEQTGSFRTPFVDIFSMKKGLPTVKKAVGSISPPLKAITSSPPSCLRLGSIFRQICSSQTSTACIASTVSFQAIRQLRAANPLSGGNQIALCTGAAMRASFVTSKKSPTAIDVLNSSFYCCFLGQFPIPTPEMAWRWLNSSFS